MSKSAVSGARLIAPITSGTGLAAEVPETVSRGVSAIIRAETPRIASATGRLK